MTALSAMAAMASLTAMTHHSEPASGANLRELNRHDVALTREQELWAIALWVEETQGESAWFYIAQQKDRLLADGDPLGLRLWSEVERRLEMLAHGSATHN